MHIHLSLMSRPIKRFYFYIGKRIYSNFDVSFFNTFQYGVYQLSPIETLHQTHFLQIKDKVYKVILNKIEERYLHLTIV